MGANPHFLNKKLSQILSFLHQLSPIQKLFLNTHNFSSQKLNKLTTLSPEGLFPALDETTEELFSQIQEIDGKVYPQVGVLKDFDEVFEQITKIEAKLEEYLVDQKKRLKCNEIHYFHTRFAQQNSQDYQLEVPEKIVEGNKRPEEYQLTSKKKGFLRFHTDFIIDCLESVYILKEEMRHTLVPFIIKFLKILLAKKNIFFKSILVLQSLIVWLLCPNALQI
eukprot:TRINITY_DN5543_c0_g1_i2.p1 TRINITY_DN5543_c0_g1~~TRINITY_DN5543_c0_g1_i2.p1  ORF type:complete len:222 (-),score=29.82 TRINITY_DN5543_c0_g1_i2:254-919(-)